MAHFTVYTRNGCSYCTSAKGWLMSHGHTFDERNVQDDPSLMEQFQAAAPGARTVPQILLADYLIGGYTDLIDASHNGVLKMLLGE